LLLLPVVLSYCCRNNHVDIHLQSPTKNLFWVVPKMLSPTPKIFGLSFVCSNVDGLASIGQTGLDIDSEIMTRGTFGLTEYFGVT